VLTGQIAKRIEQLIRQGCRVNDWDVYELAIEPNHVHLYMGAQPKYSCSQIMKIIKGGTSKKIREEYPELDEVFGDLMLRSGLMVTLLKVLVLLQTK